VHIVGNETTNTATCQNYLSVDVTLWVHYAQANSSLAQWTNAGQRSFDQTVMWLCCLCPRLASRVVPLEFPQIVKDLVSRQTSLKKTTPFMLQHGIGQQN
jgi:hypothetical protein